jgi:hypothetical protein
MRFSITDVRGSIHEYLLKNKEFLGILCRDVLLCLIVCAVGLSGFWAGKIERGGGVACPVVLENVFPTSTSPVALQNTAPAPPVFHATASSVSVPKNPATTGEGQGVVASKNGTKYHFPWCPGASQIKDENKIWFASEAAATAAGYAKAKNCQ